MPKTDKPKMTAGEATVLNMLRNDGMCAAAGPMVAPGAAATVSAGGRSGKRKKRRTTTRTHRTVT